MKYERKIIYDIILRLTHWTLAFSCLVLMFSAWTAEIFFEEGLYRKSLWIVHIFAGYGLAASLFVRIIWGFVGPQHARWSELFKIKEWLLVLKTKKLNAKWDWGHHPYASIAYLSFYGVILVLSVTGIFLAAIEHNQGPLAERFFDELGLKHDFSEVHEFFAWFVVFFVVTHLVGLIWHERKDKIPVAQSMISGYQYKQEVEASDEKK
jgi:cytochrome b